MISKQSSQFVVNFVPQVLPQKSYVLTFQWFAFFLGREDTIFTKVESNHVDNNIKPPLKIRI